MGNKIVLIWISIFVLSGAIVQFDRTQFALTTPFDNTTNGFTSTNVQAAIEESKSYVLNKDRSSLVFGFDGTASSGRWLETFTNVASNTSGYVSPNAITILELTLACGSSTSVVIGLYKNLVQVGTITLSSQRTKVESKSINFAQADEMAAKVESGSCSRPVMIVNNRLQ